MMMMMMMMMGVELGRENCFVCVVFGFELCLE